ncbi:MAG: transglutaminase family protein [Paenibacillaceae bacterium]|nr:transglutaminase family protein [Paenibacillaceae bacterium]
MKLEISHLTRYTYAEPVTDSVNEIRLTPRTNSRQSCYSQAIAIEPNASLFTYEDYFGNRVHAFTVNKPHRQLMIRTTTTVVTENSGPSPDNGMTPEEERRWIDDESTHNRYAEYLLPTPYTSATPEVRQFAAGIGALDDGVYAWLRKLSLTIKSEFVYDPQATHVRTQVDEMLRLGRGVCQDFAHLMLAVCRYRGIPARYVSGYHFVGDLQGGSADFEQASHAWIEAFVPGAGWRGFDPTNDATIDGRYVKLGHGRDYPDIVPVKGVYRGTGEQRLEVLVDVRRVED